METYARKVADLPVSESVLFGELWRQRTRSHIVSLEEGVLQHWHFGRIALLGDAAHKVTPNAGFGGSTAMESAVTLTNHLKAAINAHPNKKPSDVELSEALEGYQNDRLPRVTEVFWVSWALTRLQAYDGWPMYIIQRWLLPIIGLDRIGANVAHSCCQAPQLSFVPYQQRQGTFKWANTQIVTDNTAAKKQLVATRKDINWGATCLSVAVLVCSMAWLSGFGTKPLQDLAQRNLTSVALA
jgi:hypothetical protein